ncbi:hypothetical protein C8J57DRAFT_343228 [Mycena rebaudengoi]|nr:hypothetical protein C8J57DRAFT_343228 [Mycena rebaudengoi]
MIIPRKSNLVRFYVQLPTTEGDKMCPSIATKATQDKKIFDRYDLEFGYVDWFSVPDRSAHCVAVHARPQKYTHTHSPQAGQGMNISMLNMYLLGSCNAPNDACPEESSVSLPRSVRFLIHSNGLSISSTFNSQASSGHSLANTPFRPSHHARCNIAALAPTAADIALPPNGAFHAICSIRPRTARRDAAALDTPYLYLFPFY